MKHFMISGELAVDRDVVGVDEVADPHLGGDRLRRLVDAAVGRHMRVAVDNARRDLSAGGIDDRCPLGNRHVLAHGKNLSLADDQRSAFDDSRRPARPDRRILERDQL